jgi:hypothetical protein
VRDAWLETQGETKIVSEVELGARHPFHLLLYYHACMHACPIVRDDLASK